MQLKVKNRKLLGPVILGIFLIIAIIGPWIAPYSPSRIDLEHEFSPPSISHVLGTGENGIDILSALFHGARLSFTIATTVIIISTIIGTLLGSLAAWKGGVIETIIMRGVDLFMAFPSILLNLAFVAFIAEPNIIHIIIALSLNGWVSYARLSYSQTLILKTKDFILSARALGVNEYVILLKHILPNIIPAIIIQASFGFGVVVLTESTLSFLGLGAQGVISWGTLLDQGVSYLLITPRIVLASGIPIALVMLGSNLTGDFLNEILNQSNTI